MKQLAPGLLLVGAAFWSTTIFAGFLDVTTVGTTVADATFTGTLDGVGVSGESVISGVPTGAPVAGFLFRPAGTNYLTSTLDGTSPQYSYSSVFGDTTATADRVGYAMAGGFTNPRIATVTVSFDAFIQGVVFHIANLDGMQVEFSGKSTSDLTLLNSNGGAGDGLELTGNTLRDANSTTSVGTAPASAPPTTGNRSGYGSVLISGSFDSGNPLTLVMSKNPLLTNPLSGDGGNFTFSTIAVSSPTPGTVPEPGTLALLALGLLGIRYSSSSSRRGRATP